MERKLNSDSWKNEYEPSHDEHISNGPVDSRPPQLSQQVPGHGQSSEGCHDMGERDVNHGRSDLNFSDNLAYAAWYQTRHFGHRSIGEDRDDRDSGQEGVEPNQLRPEECECTCHLKMMPDGRLVRQPCNVGALATHSVASSLVVGHASNSEQCSEGSVLWETRSSTTSEFDAFIGAVFPTQTTPSNAHSFLSLSPDVSFARIVELPLYYPMSLSMSEESGSETDMRDLPL